MRILLKTLLLLWLLIVAVGYFLPNQYQVSRTLVINANTQSIHAYTEDLKHWQNWQPWLDSDPTVKVTLGEISKGVDAFQRWTSDSSSGELIFTRADPDYGIDYDLWFNNRTSKAQSSLLYTAINAGTTQVTWVMSGQVDTPIFGSYLALAMDYMIAPSFELGLAKLKTLVEQQAAQ